MQQNDAFVNIQLDKPHRGGDEPDQVDLLRLKGTEFINRIGNVNPNSAVYDLDSGE